MNATVQAECELCGNVRPQSYTCQALTISSCWATRFRYVCLGNAKRGFHHSTPSPKTGPVCEVLPGSFEVLVARENLLQGTIPAAFFGHAMLSHLDLAVNQHQGTIPRSIGHHPQQHVMVGIYHNVHLKLLEILTPRDPKDTEKKT